MFQPLKWNLLFWDIQTVVFRWTDLGLVSRPMLKHTTRLGQSYLVDHRFTLQCICLWLFFLFKFPIPFWPETHHSEHLSDHYPSIYPSIILTINLPFQTLSWPLIYPSRHFSNHTFTLSDNLSVHHFTLADTFSDWQFAVGEACKPIIWPTHSVLYGRDLW